MTGKEAYELQYKRKINNIIEKNSDKPYLKGFYNYMRGSISDSTIYNYLCYIVNFMDYNHKKIEDLDLDDYTAFKAQFSNRTASYQINVHSGLKSFATYLVDSNKVSCNLMKNIKRPRFIEQEETISKREIGYLDKKEIKKYVSAVKSGVGSHRSKKRQKNWKERDLLIIIILLTTGIRCSALYKLDVDKVDIVNKCILVTDKGGKYKKCDISDDVIECYNSWIEKRNTLLGNIKEDALFISNERTRMSQASIARVVNKYSEKIKNKNITPHKLRATFGTQLYNETKDIYYVQKKMGHTNPKTTEIYIRGEEEDGVRASDIMSKMFR